MSMEGMTILDMDNLNSPCLSIGCSSIDTMLNGGIGIGITEICGEASCGKSQISLQLACQAQLPITEGGLEGKVVIICTEPPFPMDRLKQYVNVYLSKYPQLFPNANVMMRNIYIVDSTTNITLTLAFLDKLERQLKDGQIKLVIIDSVAALFRGSEDFSSAVDDLTMRVEYLALFSNKIKELSGVFQVPFVVMNQVTSKSIVTNGISKNSLVPALGVYWSNCVNTRIMIKRERDRTEGNVRSMRVILSSSIPNSRSALFCIEREGVVDYQPIIIEKSNKNNNLSNNKASANNSEEDNNNGVGWKNDREEEKKDERVVKENEDIGSESEDLIMVVNSKENLENDDRE